MTRALELGQASPSQSPLHRQIRVHVAVDHSLVEDRRPTSQRGDKLSIWMNGEKLKILAMTFFAAVC